MAKKKKNSIVGNFLEAAMEVLSLPSLAPPFNQSTFLPLSPQPCHCLSTVSFIFIFVSWVFHNLQWVLSISILNTSNSIPNSSNSARNICLAPRKNAPLYPDPTRHRSAPERHRLPPRRDPFTSRLMAPLVQERLPVSCLRCRATGVNSRVLFGMS